MYPLPEAARKKLFEGEKAPLGTFFAKIEVASALHLIDVHEYRTLHALRDIRNKFAHDVDDIHVDSPDADLAKRFSKLPKLGKHARTFVWAILTQAEVGYGAQSCPGCAQARTGQNVGRIMHRKI